MGDPLDARQRGARQQVRRGVVAAEDAPHPAALLDGPAVEIGQLGSTVARRPQYHGRLPRAAGQQFAADVEHVRRPAGQHFGEA
jgi:hypothetical protein